MPASLSKKIFKDKSFIIIPAPTIESLEDESKQQHNCVRTYAEDYALGRCDMYLMRNRISPDESLVTVEVKNNKVVQSRIKYNLNPNEKQKKFLENGTKNTERSSLIMNRKCTKANNTKTTIDKNHQRIENIISSGEYENFLKFCNTFHHYSFNNIILIFSQMKEATKVAGFKQWQKLGRKIKKGEKGIRIIYPIKN